MSRYIIGLQWPADGQTADRFHAEPFPGRATRTIITDPHPLALKSLNHSCSSLPHVKNYTPPAASDKRTEALMTRGRQGRFLDQRDSAKAIEIKKEAE